MRRTLRIAANGGGLRPDASACPGWIGMAAGNARYRYADAGVRRRRRAARLRQDSSACSMCLASASCRSRSAATRSEPRPPGLHGAVGRAGDPGAGQPPPGRLGGRAGAFRHRLAARGGARKGRADRCRRHRPGAAAARHLSASCGTGMSMARLILLYGARSPRDLLYRKELSAWAHAAGHARCLPTVDYGGVNWRGHVGVVTTLFRYLRLQSGPHRGFDLRAGDHDALRDCRIARTAAWRRRTFICRWSAT